MEARKEEKTSSERGRARSYRVIEPESEEGGGGGKTRQWTDVDSQLEGRVFSQSAKDRGRRGEWECLDRAAAKEGLATAEVGDKVDAAIVVSAQRTDETDASAREISEPCNIVRRDGITK